MKNVMMIALLLLVGGVSFGQKFRHDPTYSVNNYKHPNKAAEAKATDNSTKLEAANVETADNYKHPQATTTAKKYTVKSTPKQSGSYKHPYGL
jgi:hypothetical protein